MTTTTTRQSSSSSWSATDRLSFLLAYLVCGILHEGFHVAAASWLVPTDANAYTPTTMPQLLWQSLFRYCRVATTTASTSSRTLALVRHAGWMGSSCVAALVVWGVYAFHFRCTTTTTKSRPSYQSPFVAAAVVTALEALSTDLLFGMAYHSSNSTIITSTTTNNVLLFCGNFGIILLNPAWHHTDALDLLQEMVRITMMRGAQSGGIVTWQRRASGRLQGRRVRIVGGKRTDLSTDLRARIARVPRNTASRRANPVPPMWLGHTRFATTSVADFGGTHPHQWTPPAIRRVYPHDGTLWTTTKGSRQQTSIKPVIKFCENFITHNGDLDFYNLDHARVISLQMLQDWLAAALGVPSPNSVDSVAIAGLMDLLRTKGCLALSLRYAVLLGAHGACGFTAASVGVRTFPSYAEYEVVGRVLEGALEHYCKEQSKTLGELRDDPDLRSALCEGIMMALRAVPSGKFDKTELAFLFVDDFEQGHARLLEVITSTVDAFLDNDIFRAVKLFFKNATGSFGLMATSSEDAHRQICIAARGQPMSIAIYPELGVCYGSELAAVKVPLGVSARPAARGGGGTKSSRSLSFRHLDVDTSRHRLKVEEHLPPSTPGLSKPCSRLDLDDLVGEVVLVDWGTTGAPVVSLHSYLESRARETRVKDRITNLTGNDLLLPLPKQSKEPILDELCEIPSALEKIQKNWQSGDMNRLAAFNLGLQVRKRLQARIDGKVPAHPGVVDILVTGCEVSLWAAEQFASDLQKCFPRMGVKAISSNKLLGVLGQDLVVPSFGFPLSSSTPDLHDAIVIIVSQSGSTFGPLSISKLLQSVTHQIFAVTSEWDTQISKQLRSVDKGPNKGSFTITNRVFTTNVGVRMAEPCSLTVAATHQLLTQILAHVSLTILSNREFCQLTGAVVTDEDLRILERCNRENIAALSSIVGVGDKDDHVVTESEKTLRKAGKLWANHVLETARAYLLSILYIVATVTSGYPLVSGLASVAGYDSDDILYVLRFLDSLIYVFLPQINVLLIRLWQGRKLTHRMVARTVVIGDIPWVAQSANAFLSKIFARSYSIAGVNVLSGNPADHLVHKHTHRIVRGTLLVCGRPDGRLSALTTAECAVNLTVNQASSIRSSGTTCCESMTIGHNPWELGLTKADIFLQSFRPAFFCEKVTGSVADSTRRKRTALMLRETRDTPLGKLDSVNASRRSSRSNSLRRSARDSVSNMHLESTGVGSWLSTIRGFFCYCFAYPCGRQKEDLIDITSHSTGHDLKAKFASLQFEDSATSSREDAAVKSLLKERSQNVRYTSQRNLSSQGSARLETQPEEREFVEAFHQEGQLAEIVPSTTSSRQLRRQSLHHSDSVRMEVTPSDERYFGQDVDTSDMGISDHDLLTSQHFAMELYETRIASLQRFVAMCVMFHEMGKTVQDFFPRVSLGCIGYRMEQTHSVMRVATTASPVSGDAVREQMEKLRARSEVLQAVRVISGAWHRYQKRRIKELKNFHRNWSEGQQQSSAENLFSILMPSTPQLSAPAPARTTRRHSSARSLKSANYNDARASIKFSLGTIADAMGEIE